MKYTSNIRSKTTKIQNLTEKYNLEIDDDLNEIKDAVGIYQEKLMAAVAEAENEREKMSPMTQEVESVSIR